jgi:membrane-anchored glycerophosphoryl diester phosphodiesterase (GDPDase)
MTFQFIYFCLKFLLACSSHNLVSHIFKFTKGKEKKKKRKRKKRKIEKKNIWVFLASLIPNGFHAKTISSMSNTKD